MDVTENSVRSRFSTCLARFMVCMIIHLIRSLSDGISEYNEEVLIVISPKELCASRKNRMEWISVKDALPNEKCRVIVWTCNQHFYDAYFDGEKFDSDSCFSCDVTHWMIPDSPY